MLLLFLLPRTHLLHMQYILQILLRLYLLMWYIALLDKFDLSMLNHLFKCLLSNQQHKSLRQQMQCLHYKQYMLHLQLMFCLLGNLCMLHLQLMFCLLGNLCMLHLHRLMFCLLRNLYISEYPRRRLLLCLPDS